MASAAYEGGGAGGKLRKRPFRRSAAATPYDRPATAVRGVPLPASHRNGWLSRIVDPASRIIASGASKLFSSVFRKQPLALPATPPSAPLQPQPEENIRSDHEVPEVICLNSTCEVKEKEGNNVINPTDNLKVDEFSELEKLLKQKTFTRTEFIYLTELLQSRTLESGKAGPEDNSKEAAVLGKEKETGTADLHGNISTPKGGLSIHEEEVASPSEIAKAYMGSRPSIKEGMVVTSNQPYAVRKSNISVAPKSIVRFSGVTEHPDNGYFTPRPRGRSAIFKMSRSPYFNVQTAADIKGGLPNNRDGYPDPSTSSQSVATSPSVSSSKQALKRGSSVLDDDFGSFGPIRRIRQKSNLMFPSKDTLASPTANILSSSSTKVGRQAIYESTPAIKNPLQFNVPKHGLIGSKHVEISDNNRLDGNGMARRISQQLDKLLPSPKGKSSEPKSISKNELPSKLTLDMLHGRAIRSMEAIGSSNFVNAQSSGNVVATSISNPPSLPQKQEVQQNGPLKPAVSQVKQTSECDGPVQAITHATDAKSNKKTQGVIITGPVAVPLQEKPAFRISAPEDSLEMDDDDDDNIKPPVSSTNGKDKEEMKELKATVSEAQFSEKVMVSSSQSMPASTTKLFGEIDKRTSDGFVGFSLPVTPVPSMAAQQPRMPTIETPTPEGSAHDKEKSPVSLFKFGSKPLELTAISSNTTGPAGLQSDSSLKAEPELSTSNSVTAVKQKGADLDNGDKMQRAGEASKSFGSSNSSDLSISTNPSIFAFGASANHGLNNGLLNSKPFPVFGPNTPDNQTISDSTTVTTTATISSSSSILSATPIFSTVATSQSFSATTSAPSSVSTTLEKSGLNGLDAKPTSLISFSSTSSVEASTGFNMGSSSSTGSSSSSTLVTISPSSSASTGSALYSASSAFSTMGSSSSQVVSSLLSSSTSGSSAFSTPSLFSSTHSSSSTSATSSTSASTLGSHPALPSSPLFSSTGSSIFGLTSPAQSTSSSLSMASSSSQISTSNFGATAGFVFGTQATSATSESSNISVSQSTSQLGSFTSSPSFGLSGSSSLSFGNSPFGSAAPSSKPFGSSTGFSFSASAVSSSCASSLSVSLLSSSSQSLATPTFGATFGSNPPSTTFTFGASAPDSGCSPFIFGSSSGSTFSFTSGSNTTSNSSTPAQPAFQVLPPVNFGSAFPQNDQMNIEDSMTDDTVQPTVPAALTFGQPASSPATLPFGQPASNPATSPFGQPASNPATPPFGQPASSPGAPFMFGSPANPQGGQQAFNFGSQQNSVHPSSNPFQPVLGGSFSLGSTGGDDKSGRKIVRPRRKPRK